MGVVHVSLRTQGNKMADIGSWLLVYVRLYSGSLFFFCRGFVSCGTLQWNNITGRSLVVKRQEKGEAKMQWTYLVRLQTSFS